MTSRSFFANCVSYGLGWALILTLMICEPASGQQAIDYARDIRPILANKCYNCHGPDENTREGGFRLDLRESALGEADSGEFPIVAGQPDSSEMLIRIHATDESRMPPADQDKQLTDDEKELLKKWIAEGAHWKLHWAFAAPEVPKAPDASGVTYAENFLPRNNIDRIVWRSLQEKGLSPKPIAEQETLIRRVYLDLLGLPPTQAQITNHMADKDEGAYERMIDGLLESPHFGEHLATEWLDAARFADTNGYQNDFSRNMWPWRDWVIRAFNDNMPFDQFAIEQLAGDMLPDATLDQKIATGFNRNHRSVTEGGSIEEEWLVENIIDRVDTTSTVFLGLTMGCARCHDHKFDPISQKEFYEFYAFFNGINEKGVHLEKRGNVPPLVHVPSPEYDEKLNQVDRSIAELQQRIKQLQKGSLGAQAKWEEELVRGPNPNLPENPVTAILHGTTNSADASLPETLHKRLAGTYGDSIESSEGPTNQFVSIEDRENAHLDLGDHGSIDGSLPFSISAWTRPEKFGAIISRMDHNNAYRGFDLLLMPDGRLNVHLIHDWPSNAIKITTQSALKTKTWNHVSVTYDGSQKASGIKIRVNDQTVKFQVNNDNLTGSTLTKHPLWLGYRGHTQRFAGGIAGIQIYDRQLSGVEQTAIYTQGLRAMAATPADKRSVANANTLSTIFNTTASPEFSEVQRKIAELTKERQKLRDNLPTTMVMEELPQARPTYILNRGQYDQPIREQQVSPNVPRMLPSFEGYDKNRLGLAKWIVAAENPLTARVFVNRIWQRMFGIGLVESAENFGVQSPLPIHPELLDWLAVDFRQNGWDIKRLHKTILMSATYQQSSRAEADEFVRDPKNVMLSRGPRFRLSAEAIRDGALAASGLLNTKIGGPSIKPYQPEGLWGELAGGASQGPYVQDKDEQLYRRSLYIYRKRTVPHPTMTTFDGGSREICQVARTRTNTPLQALALLNDPTYVEASRALAANAMRASSNPQEQIRYAFRSVLARTPNEKEQAVLARSLKRYSTRFAADPQSASNFIANGLSKPAEDLEPSKLASLTAVCSIIFNLDEAVTKE